MISQIRQRTPSRDEASVLPVQRQLFDDVAVTSADFWTNIRTRTYTRLVHWIGDARQKLNEFVADMAGSEGGKAWAEVIQGWIGTLGTYGDAVNAVVTTLRETLGAGLGVRKSLFEFRSSMETNFDNLSSALAKMDDGLPIYRALNVAEAAERSSADAAKHRMEWRTGLERALSTLPSPTDLRKELLRGWARGSVDKRGFTSTFKIHLEIRCQVIKEGDRYSWSETTWRDQRLLRPPRAYISGPDSRKVLKMLPKIYGNQAPLHTLGLRLTTYFFVNFYDWTGIGPHNLDRYTGGTTYGVPGYKFEDGTWAPGGTITDGGRGPYTGEARHEIFSGWLRQGRKPVVADLRYISGG